MKRHYLLLLLIFSAFAKISTAQTSAFTTDDVAGIYVKDFPYVIQDEKPGPGADHSWSLTLSTDGTFEYHNFRQLKGQAEEHWYAQGNWSFDGKIISFTTSASDIDEKYKIDLNNSKARFFKKSPRSKSVKAKPTYVQFYESKYSITQSLKLFKTNE